MNSSQSAAALHRAIRPMRSTGSAVASFVAGSLILGTIGIFVREAQADPITTTWFRCAFGLLGLTAWMLVRGPAAGLRLRRAGAGRMLLAAALMVLAWSLFFSAIERTSAGVASVLFHMQPLWLLLLAALVLQERIARRRVLAVGIAMAGLVLATGLVDDLARTHTPVLQADYWVGVGFCLLGALCTAVVTLIAARSGDTPAAVLAWWQCAIGTAALAAWPATQGWPAWGLSWAWLASLGLIHTGLAYTLMYAGIARLPAERIAMLQFLYPVMAIVVDWLCYGERLGALQVSGMALMGAAIWHAERSRGAP